MTRADPSPAYVIAARRTALGRVGGLHKTRRVEDLAAPVLTAVLADAGLGADRVDEVIAGNTQAGGNPARLIALTAGLPETTPALTIDRHHGSGLDAILAGARLIALGDARVVIAGGAESLSTAPWRVARPRTVYQTPRFLHGDAPPGDGDPAWESTELLAARLGLTRSMQDAFAFKSHLRADAAREERQFVREIVPLRANPDEARDQSAVGPVLDDIEATTPYLPPEGTLTPGNTPLPHDGAAFVALVCESVWIELGRPPALRLMGSAVHGVGHDSEAAAPIAALQALSRRHDGLDIGQLAAIELGESSAAQALALLKQFDVDDSRLNPCGGALVRGVAPGAAGAVLVVRLFTDLLRSVQQPKRFRQTTRLGAVVQETGDGFGIAALFEALGGPTGP